MPPSGAHRRAITSPLGTTGLLMLAVIAHASTPVAAWSQDDPASEVPRFLDDTIGQTVRLPMGSRNSLGWTLRVRTSSHATADTMRVEVEFATTGGPTTAEQVLELRLRPIAAGHSPPQSSARVSLPLTIPEGTDRIQFARHVPKSSFGNLYRVELRQDGRQVPGGEATIGQPIADPEYAIYYNESQQNAWKVLWVESDADESIRLKSMQLLSLFNNPQPFQVAATPQQWEEMVQTGINENSGPSVVNRSIDQMPLDWRALRGFDAVMVHRTDWERLASSDSPSAIAIRDWVHAGGVLIVRDASPSFDTAATGSTATGKAIANTGTRPAVDSLREMIQQVDTGKLDAYATMNEQTFASQNRFFDFSAENIQAWQDWFPKAAKMIRQSIQDYPITLATSASGVRQKEAMAGSVIYLGDQPDEEPVQILQWAAVIDLMSWHRHRLTRSGVEPILGSQRFFQWVIPGVAQPPVYTFMGLLGLFVILVGPVAYRKTAKAGRSYLMFAIAPVLALATTGAMLGYGVISDGFGTRVRSRQITWVDGATGDAFTRTRSTYFAGIRPAEGLTFAPDAEVTLYPDNQNRGWEARLDDRFESRGLVTATAEALRLSREFLPSRQQKQFVVHRPSHQWGRIRIDAIAGNDASSNSDAQLEDGAPIIGPKSIRVSSELSSPLQELIICDAQKRYFFVDELAAGQSATATRISREDASTRMGEMYKRQWLVSSIIGQNQGTGQRNVNRRNNTTDLLARQLSTLQSTVKPTEGAFEFELQQRMQLQSDLPANSFLGLTDLTADAVAIPDAQPTASIHYVFGTLP
ncbi:hypothetical protein [Allorhodopirellula solitaria]|uniref:Uncharacterized protein n=1 Tax=Allorhodopirellula solitaria TaxID=2527987 RepID=A0A5C5X822_9BACT|nr:hypothetical protein [Allorhodopirellula solitaria]TWT59216.1 hypothetical protein CA85_39120 [Allorhodopirellula solitaria]